MVRVVGEEGPCLSTARSAVSARIPSHCTLRLESDGRHRVSRGDPNGVKPAYQVSPVVAAVFVAQIPNMVGSNCARSRKGEGYLKELLAAEICGAFPTLAR